MGSDKEVTAERKAQERMRRHAVMEILHFASIGDIDGLSTLASENELCVSPQYTPMCTFHVNVRPPFKDICCKINQTYTELP